MTSRVIKSIKDPLALAAAGDNRGQGETRTLLHLVLACGSILFCIGVDQPRILGEHIRATVKVVDQRPALWRPHKRGLLDLEIRLPGRVHRNLPRYWASGWSGWNIVSASSTSQFSRASRYLASMEAARAMMVVGWPVDI